MNENSPNPTAELTRRLVKGDEAAFRMFYAAYSDRLTRYLWVLARGDEARLRDALQSTLLRVVKYIRVFSEEDMFWSWLTVLARSAFLDEGRKLRRYRSFLERFKRHPESDFIPTGSGPCGDEKLNDLLDQALAALPEEERALLVSRYFLPRLVSAVAEDRNTTEKAVQSKLARIRRKLKESILARLKHD